MQHYTLKQNRNRIEYEILKYQSTLAPGLVPEVYSYDPIMNCTSMEDLSDHVIMRTEMINHKQFKKFADDITTFMVNTLLLTSDVCMEHKAKKELVKNFINPELCEISEDLVYTEPFSDINNRNDIFAPNIDWVKENIYSDEALKLETAKLKFDFMNNAQAYEKASEYTAKYKGFKEYYLDTILRDTAAVTGLEGIRRIVGIAHVKDITSIQDEEQRTKAERLCMLASKSFIMNREELKTGKDFLEVIKQNKDKAVPEIIKFLKAEAHFIRDEDEKVCKAIGEYSLSLLKPEMGILTHCNAGTIATAKYGTALAPLYLGAEKGYNFKVFADETRPLLQGARLTAWELNEAGIDVTLICDNMASIVMKNGWIDAVVVGCDRVVYNGDTANKIGTSGVAILAKEYGINDMKSQGLQKLSKPIIQLLM